MRRWILIVALLCSVPLLAKQHKAAGKVLDDAAFKSIKTYCVDTSSMYQTEADATKRALKEATKPKGVLSELSWKLLDSCAGADAVLGIEFKEHSVMAQATEGGSMAGAAVSNNTDEFFEAALTLTQQSSGKAVYQAQGSQAPNSREDALRKSFKIFAQDVESLGQ